MRKQLLFVSAFVLMFCELSLSQPPADPTCPTVSIDGRHLKESLQFSATVDLKTWPGPIEYRWSASSHDPSTGKTDSSIIAEGQGTPHIKILKRESTIRATLEIFGFPSHCANTASSVTRWDPVPEPVKLGQFFDSVRAEQKAELIDIGRRMKENPNARLVVIFGYASHTKRSAIDANQRTVLDALIATGVNRSGIKFYTLQRGKRIAEFWLVPAGAKDPTCDECDVVETPEKSSLSGNAGSREKPITPRANSSP